MNHNDSKIIARENLHQGFYTIQKIKLQHKLFKGGWSAPFERELIVRYDAVGVLPYDPKLDKVVLIEQFRIGALGANQSPWLLELVAGIIDKKASKENLAIMEAQEEAGLAIQRLIPIYEYFSSPGGSTEYISLYCGIVDAKGAGGIHGIEQEHEDIKVHVLDRKEAFNSIKTGQINNAATIIALQWLQLNIDNLQQKK